MCCFSSFGDVITLHFPLKLDVARRFSLAVDCQAQRCVSASARGESLRARRQVPPAHPCLGSAGCSGFHQPEFQSIHNETELVLGLLGDTAFM